MAGKPKVKTFNSDRAGILASVSNRTRLFALLALVLEGLFVIASTTLPPDQRFNAFIISTGGVVLALLIVFALEVRFRSDLNQEMPPYVGEWHGYIRWTDTWAHKLWQFTPVNPHSDGDLYIYRSSSGVYKAFSLWTIKNEDNPYGIAAALSNNFTFEDGALTSFDIKAQARRAIDPNAIYGASPRYTFRLRDVSPTRMAGCVTTIVERSEAEVGTVIFERQ